MKQPQVITLAQAMEKARRYCAYQERCHSELRDKLFSMGLHTGEADQAMARMVEEGYLNEERFARAFAGGKFRQQHWGRVRIRLELKSRQVSDYCIRVALSEIEEADYLRVLRMELEKKMKTISGRDMRVKKHKAARYLQSRGFEADLVWELLNEAGPEFQR